MLRKEDLWAAIRTYCINKCCEGYTKTVLLCDGTDCPLWYYRMGRPPNPSEVEVNK